MKFLVAGFLGMALWAQTGVAQERNFGLGFILGNPTALSLKWFASPKQAADFQVAVNGDDFLLGWADYLFHYPDFFGQDNQFSRNLTPYVGVGPLVAVATQSDHDEGDFFDQRDDDFAVGVRVPFGMDWFWNRVPLAIGLELAPGIVVAPATAGFVQGGLTFRFYF